MENSSSQNIRKRRRRRRRRTGKKSATQSLQALDYIFLQEEQRYFHLALWSRKQYYRAMSSCEALSPQEPLSFFLSTCFTMASSTPMITILVTVIGKMKSNKTKQKRKYKSRNSGLQLYSTKFQFSAISLLLPNFIFDTCSFLKCFPLLLIHSVIYLNRFCAKI